MMGCIGLSAASIAMQCADDDLGTQTRLGAERIQRAAGRMARRVNDLVDIASIDAGKLAIVCQQADCVRLMAEALETWRASATAKKIVLEARSAGAVRANIDRERVLQILGNLITNAIKFSPEGGTVVLAPGCSSFDMFADYAARGRSFKDEARRLAADVQQGPVVS